MVTWHAPTNLIQMFRLVADRPDTPDWLPDPDDDSPILNIGHGAKLIYGAEHLDLPEWDADQRMPIPFPDEHFSAIYAIHLLEHVEDPRWLLRELQRVLMVGGHLNIGLPYYNSQMHAQDLDHKSNWCEETWKETFFNDYYQKEHGGWKFKIGANFIMAIVERNTMLITQLIRTK